MYELGRLKREKIEILLNLDDEGVERYILSLSHSYYKAILEMDYQAINSVVGSLKFIVETFEYKYPDIHDYINYSLVMSGNRILGNVFDVDGALWIPSEKSLEFHRGLTFSLDASRIKIINEAQDIKEMYDLVVNDASIDNRIVEGISNLYVETKKYLEVKE